MLKLEFPKDLHLYVFFLIYVNDLSDGLTSTRKLFPDDISLFSIVYDVNLAANKLNSDLIEIWFGFEILNWLCNGKGISIFFLQNKQKSLFLVEKLSKSITFHYLEQSSK